MLVMRRDNALPFRMHFTGVHAHRRPVDVREDKSTAGAGAQNHGLTSHNKSFPLFTRPEKGPEYKSTFPGPRFSIAAVCRDR
ncbi:hypothetical protein EVAR_80476_1 [Eumeta japonica]|uniref:Uncharacterized protein n=1 Tax=Eumeta variegata TaxID=151549 RepID=A0A4C1YNJ2_EUMVA|nr:hypothetical protein EVAR_80476_1 [Eumeta japonica]